jgi:hypothetical protein
MGDRADMSKERRYESKDSREMEKCSMSPTLGRVSVELRADERYFLGHRAFSSVGEGYSISGGRCDRSDYAHWKIHAAVIDNWKS